MFGTLNVRNVQTLIRYLKEEFLHLDQLVGLQRILFLLSLVSICSVTVDTFKQ